MNEELLQYIWLSGLFNHQELVSIDGQDIQIIKRGKLNKNAGPDFNNAHIRIGDTEWVGHVEIHIYAAEWYKHGHQNDKAYNNTILHVVYENGAECLREDKSSLTCLVLKTCINPEFLQRYEQLRTEGAWIACGNFIGQVDALTKHQALECALVNRLERKSRMVRQWLNRVENDWHSVFYFALARSFGFGTNSEAFEQLAYHLPAQIIGKHKGNLTQVDALIFGIAGFLEGEDLDAYHGALKIEWLFLKQKYGLREMEKSMFKFMRMRPGNFPCIRLAQFSALINQNSDLFETILSSVNSAEIFPQLEVELPDYWNHHYYFGKHSQKHTTILSQHSKANIIINAIIPVLFVYGKVNGIESMSTRATDLLMDLPPENNHIISAWKQFGMEAENAFDSQALLELKRNYCDEKKCLGCKIGNRVLNPELQTSEMTRK